MDDLVKFLRARLDEEQREAEKQPDGEEVMLDSWEIMATAETNYPGYEYLRIAKARVLAEAEAKRALIDAVERADARASFPDFDGGVYSGLHDALEYLALPYADHPDYRDEWRP